VAQRLPAEEALAVARGIDDAERRARALAEVAQRLVKGVEVGDALASPSRRCATMIITTRPLYLPFGNIEAHSPRGPECRLSVTSFCPPPFVAIRVGNRGSSMGRPRHVT
jgi:hypothetical protein